MDAAKVRRPPLAVEELERQTAQRGLVRVEDVHGDAHRILLVKFDCTRPVVRR